MAKPAPKFDAKIKAEYRRLFDAATINPARAGDVLVTAKKIIANRARYELVSARMNGMPWFIIGIKHQMECGGSFAKHLHNGDPLTKRTRLVPAGRPLTPGPWTWEESACDALTFKGLEKIGPDGWTIERICYEFERFNGFGYRQYHPETLSPYLWSYTNQYKRGKYVADGKWSASAVSKQSGAIAILLQIDMLCDDFDLKNEAKPLVETAQQKSVVASVGAGAVGLYEWFTGGLSKLFHATGDAVTSIPTFVSSAREPVEAVQTSASWLGINANSATVAVLAVLFSLAVLRIVQKART